MNPLDKNDQLDQLVNKFKDFLNEKSDTSKEYEIELDYLKTLQKAGQRIQSQCEELNLDPKFSDALLLTINSEDSDEFQVEHLLLQDVIRIYNQFKEINTQSSLKADFVLAYFFELLQGNDLAQSITLDRINGLIASEGFKKNIEKISTASIIQLPEKYNDQYVTLSLLHKIDHANKTSFSAFLYRVASLIAKSDGTITENEKTLLKTVKEDLFKGKEQASSIASTPVLKDDSLEKVMGELNELIGLKNIKNSITELGNFLKVQTLRSEQGLKKNSNALHAVFMGPPGTGKTSIARLIARVYKHLGYLSKGHLIETDRSGLVAGHVGQTAMKTDKIIQSALGGVLFIDEAYSLANTDSTNDFGKEAIEILLKRMEDHREDLVVIVAGYPDEMDEFISSNPGLQSRFNRYFNFNHYQPYELLEIFKLFAKNADFVLSADAEEKLNEIIERVYEKKSDHFGNARVMRNLFEKIIERQANRVISITPLSKELLMTLTEEDVPEILKTVKSILQED